MEVWKYITVTILTLVIFLITFYNLIPDNELRGTVVLVVSNLIILITFYKGIEMPRSTVSSVIQDTNLTQPLLVGFSLGNIRLAVNVKSDFEQGKFQAVIDCFKFGGNSNAEPTLIEFELDTKDKQDFKSPVNQETFVSELVKGLEDALVKSIDMNKFNQLATQLDEKMTQKLRDMK